MSEPQPDITLPGTAPSYEPPRVERVLDAEELTREILYAGTPF